MKFYWLISHVLVNSHLSLDSQVIHKNAGEQTSLGLYFTHSTRGRVVEMSDEREAEGRLISSRGWWLYPHLAPSRGTTRAEEEGV